MRRVGLGLGLVVLFLLGAPGVEAQKKEKKKGDGAMEGSPQEYAQLNKAKEIAGKLAEIVKGQKTLVLRVDIPSYEPNPSYKPPTGNGQNNLVQQYQRLMIEQQRALTITNPVQRMRAMERLQHDMQQFVQRVNQQEKNLAKNAQNQPFKVTTTAKDFELEVVDSVVTRRLELPVEYDNKGYLKTYTKAELAELRAKDSSKPGYTAKYEDLATGQQVKLYLNPTPVKSAKEKTDDEPVVKPTVKMILITAEAPAIDPAKEKKKKK